MRYIAGMHPLARLHHNQNQGARAPAVITARGVSRAVGRLSDEPVKQDDGTLVCECTSSKVMYGVGGFALGAAAVWLLNDSQKASLKASARERGGKAVARGKVAASRAAFLARDQVFKKQQNYWDKKATDAIARGDERGAKVAEAKYDEVSLKKRAFLEANGYTKD